MTIPIRVYQYRAADYSEARLAVTQIGNRFAVDRILPAGMDIAPDRWWFHTLDAAMRRFGILDNTIQGYGFHIIQTA